MIFMYIKTLCLSIQMLQVSTDWVFKKHWLLCMRNSNSSRFSNIKCFNLRLNNYLCSSCSCIVVVVVFLMRRRRTLLFFVIFSFIYRFKVVVLFVLNVNWTQIADIWQKIYGNTFVLINFLELRNFSWEF